MNGNKTPGIIFGIPIRKILYSAIAVLLLLIIVLAAAIVRNRTESGEYRNLRQNAQEYFDAGEYQEAAPLLRKAADLEETDECLVMLSECYCRMGEFDKAIEILTEVSSETMTPSNLFRRSRRGALRLMLQTWWRLPERSSPETPRACF